MNHSIVWNTLHHSVQFNAKIDFFIEHNFFSVCLVKPLYVMILTITLSLTNTWINLHCHGSIRSANECLVRCWDSLAVHSIVNGGSWCSKKAFRFFRATLSLPSFISCWGHSVQKYSLSIRFMDNNLKYWTTKRSPWISKKSFFVR